MIRNDQLETLHLTSRWNSLSGSESDSLIFHFYIFTTEKVERFFCPSFALWLFDMLIRPATSFLHYWLSHWMSRRNSSIASGGPIPTVHHRKGRKGSKFLISAPNNSLHCRKSGLNGFRPFDLQVERWLAWNVLHRRRKLFLTTFSFLQNMYTIASTLHHRNTQNGYHIRNQHLESGLR